ncbi:hypothetical protein N9C66_01445 [Akkermansiaceae bacterium]|nr:hypothetical protein [Akkermansiaceae bacterium]MDA8976617.1 hypothetical protein [bacterium]MDA9829980.1 hypothetical protein [Akkermansiaceae bacterium]MDB4383862.1 hypothetical protein [Akkermansiaceae bacterium]MDB4465503.1 hypothetical protein [Akkermansiaceae bacterium]
MAILDVIDHSVEGSEMIGHKDVFPEVTVSLSATFSFLNKKNPRQRTPAGLNAGWKLAGSSWDRNDKRRPAPPIVEPLPLK